MRTIRLSAGMAQALTDWRQQTEFPGPDSPVFPSKRGTPLHAANIWNRVLSPTKDAVGLDWLSFHSFRHFLGSMAIREQTPRELCDWLGHHDPAFSMRVYTHQLEADGPSPDFLDAELGLPEGGSTAVQQTRRNGTQMAATQGGKSAANPA